MTPGTQAVTLTRDGAIGVVHLARAHGNAINDPFLESLVAALAEAEADPAIRGVLLTAGGKIFCPGLDLQELIALDRDEMEGFIGRPMRFQFGENHMDFLAEEFLLSFSQPNFYFHAATAYDILRMKGVPIGKRDYMGQMRLKS